jgi:uncharacterized membrane protein YccC
MLSMLISQFNKRRMLVSVQLVVRDWWDEEAVVIGYILKMLIACLLAMWLSLWFELEQPRTAMLTTAIVMQSLVGMVYTKSFYRLLGTLVGIGVSFLLVGMFAQDRILFLLCMALWIGFCTAGSMLFRNHQSYGFVLAGYTLCIVGLPATLNPDQTFNIGVTRISEILIGLFCATIVSDLIFPQRMWDVMIKSVRRRFTDFSDLMRSVAINPVATSTSRPALLRFVGDIFSLESFRASTILESDDSRSHRLRLSLLNAEFMEVSTSFHALEQLLDRQRNSGHVGVSTALLDLYQPLGEVFSIDGRSARTEREADQITIKLKAFRDAFQRRLATARESLPVIHDPVVRLDFETGAELIQRFADELQAYASTYAALNSDNDLLRTESMTDVPLRLEMHFDPLIVFLAGLRGMLVFALMSGIWIFTDWGSGIEAITIGVVTSTLFAATPSPTRTIKQFFIGAVIGSMLNYVCGFHLLLDAQGFEMLALAVAPAIILAAWMTTQPAIAIVGAGTFVIFFLHVGFNSGYSANPVTFINETIADFIAIIVSGVMYGLIDLSNSGWSRRRIAKSLRELVVSACRDPIGLRRARMEKAARDLVQCSGSAQRLANIEDKDVVDWLLSALEIGHAVIALREQISGINHGKLTGVLASSLSCIADLYASPSTQQRVAAISAIDKAMNVVTETPTGSELTQSSQHQLLTMLHYMRGVMLDEKSVLAFVAPLPVAKET